jgi:DNA repair protein RecO
METVESRIIVLAVRPYRETSRLVDALCEREGRISLVARGVGGAKATGAKSLALQAALSPLTVSSVRYAIRPGADIGNLQLAEMDRDWPRIRGGLERYAWACIAAEATAQGSPARTASGEAFQSLIELLELLDGPEASLTPFHLLDALERISVVLGSSLGLSACQVCGRRQELAHVSLHGQCTGAICARCAVAGGHYVPLPLWNGIHRVGPHASPDSQPNQHFDQFRALALIIPTLWSRRLGHPLRSAGLLESILRVDHPAPPVR